MRVIDETYNGNKYPIIEREYNAYYFPDNFDPDNEKDQAEGLFTSYMNHHMVRIYNNADPR